MILHPARLALFLGATLIATTTGELRAASGVAVSRDSTVGSPDFGTQFGSFNTSFTLGADSTTYSHSTTQSGVVQTAFADFGINKVFYSAFNTTDTRSTAQGVVRSGWVDTILIQSETLNGQAGSFVGQVYIDVNYSSTGSNESNSGNYFAAYVKDQVAKHLDGTTYASYSFDATGDAFSTNHSVNNYRLEFIIPFTYGVAFDMAVVLESQITLRQSSYGIAGGSVTHNAGNTVTWGGTVAVRDAGGQAVNPEDFSMSSQSGTNFMQAIPEPSTGLLLGLAGIFALRRRRMR